VQADAKAFTVLAFNALSENLILTEYKDWSKTRGTRLEINLNNGYACRHAKRPKWIMDTNC
jgi:hypothetical protein